MFISVKSKSQGNLDTIINVSHIVKLIPSMDFLSTHITLSNGDVINAEGSFESFSNKFLLKIQEPVSVLNEAGQIPVSKDLDQYPEHLPRLPTGYVDKRTTVYKEWVAQNSEK